ncbi:helix-turn-helix transcriptional regulator [Runella sp.]|uniref:helix-turn-helix domain-containing protein n=1 Tax=Runella sp. TaxID=1960881 RepID=UPI00301AE782
MDLSANIKAIREAKRVKQLEIATALDIDPSNYAKLEKRGNKLTLEQLEKIAGALGVSVMELITGEAQTVQNDERVKELEILVNHWKELAETRNEKIKYLEKHLKGFSDILFDELSSRVFLWLQDNEPDGGAVNIKALKWHSLKTILKVLEPDELKQLYLENLRFSETLDYAIRNGLLGEEGEIIESATTEMYRKVLDYLQESYEHQSNESLKNRANSVIKKLEAYVNSSQRKEEQKALTNPKE